MSVQELKTDNFEAAISGDKATLVDFFAEWCGPCKMQTPILHKVADQNADKMNFGAVNVEIQKRLPLNTAFNQYLL